ncbi:MAG: hypothetical protein ABR976_10485 [Terracidiphilus sp.]
MKQLTNGFFLVSVLALILAAVLALAVLPPLCGQAAPKPKPSAPPQPSTPTPADTTTIPDSEVQAPVEPASAPTTAGQAPDEVTRMISDMVHAGKYAEAKKFTESLLIAYPNDGRLIKARSLIDKLIATPGSAASAPDNRQPVSAAMSSEAAPLTGMDKVDYDALILLGRKAQGTTELSEQDKLMGQFMSQSAVFLKTHPDQMLLWQLRAAIAMVANLPVAGYEAGQKLLDAGAGDGSDQNSGRLLAELKNKGYLDHAVMEKVQKEREQNAELASYSWLLGSWDVSSSSSLRMFLAPSHFTYEEEFDRSGSGFEGYSIVKHAGKSAKPDLRVTILDSGEIGWECADGSGWHPVVSSEIDSDHGTMKIVASYQFEGKTYTTTETLKRK